MAGSPDPPPESAEAEPGFISGGPELPDPDADLARALELAARITGSDRVAVWLMERPGHEEHRLLRRVHLFHEPSGFHGAGGVLPKERFPRYFQALEEADVLVVNDAESDPRTGELADAYARPLGIRSWMDVRLPPSDAPEALLRFERVDDAGRWSRRDVEKARAAALAVGRALAFEEPSEAAGDESRPTPGASALVYDEITGLGDRRLLRRDGGLLLALAKRHDRSAAVILLGIDGLEEIRDERGSVAADRLLSVLGSQLAETARECDVAVRLSGDEFAVFLGEVRGGEDALRAARRMLGDLTSSLETEGEEPDVGIRVGVAIHPDDGREVDEILARAREAMRRAPVSAVEAHAENADADRDPSPAPHRGARDLRRALETDELLLHYQPVLTLPAGELAGVESLVRWRHPRRRLLKPDQFLPRAQRAGLLPEIDRWVLRKAVRQAAEWHREAGPAWVSVNLSASTLSEPGRLVELLDQELDRSGLPPEHLIVEIESVDLRRADDAQRRCLAMLQHRGLGLAVDCRETGPAAVLTIRDLRADILKVGLGPGSEAASRNGPGPLADLLRESGGRLLAGHLETRAQFTRACESSFALGQGYYMSRPGPPEALAPERILQRQGRTGSRTGRSM